MPQLLLACHNYSVGQVWTKIYCQFSFRGITLRSHEGMIPWRIFNNPVRIRYSRPNLYIYPAKLWSIFIPLLAGQIITPRVIHTGSRFQGPTSLLVFNEIDMRNFNHLGQKTKAEVEKNVNSSSKSGSRLATTILD